MKPMKKMIVKRLLPAMLLCGSLVPVIPASDLAPFTDITPSQAAELIKEKSSDPLFKTIDVRTAAEFAESHIKGALNIDVKAPDFKDNAGKLDKNGAYLVYCRGGVRSARAMNLMKALGFREVYNLGSGIMRWQKEKLPLETTTLRH